MKKIKVAYVCIHNSCRSQMAEAITNVVAGDFFEAYSAGTNPKPSINQDAVLTVKELYDIDMEETQTPKALHRLPDNLDLLITMGCFEECPHIPAKHREDWGLSDPTGKPNTEFQNTAKKIESRIRSLRKRIEEGEIDV